MDDAGRADDRLPWIETPRQPKRSKPRPAARRAGGPLLLLLGLFLAGGVAVTAFLAGRGAEPFAPEPRASRPSATIIPAPAPAPSVPVPAPAPTTAPVIPVAPVAAAPEPAAAPARGPARPRAKKVAKPRSKPVARAATVTVRRSTPPARATPPRYPWPRPSAAGPSGRVIQLGAYPNGRQTMAAWRRLRHAYPYLATLPRKVTVVRAGPGRPHYYRLRIGAQSSGHARAICDNLHRIGRGCIVV